MTGGQNTIPVMPDEFHTMSNVTRFGTADADCIRFGCFTSVTPEDHQRSAFTQTTIDILKTNWSAN